MYSHLLYLRYIVIICFLLNCELHEGRQPTVGITALFMKDFMSTTAKALQMQANTRPARS